MGAMEAWPHVHAWRVSPRESAGLRYARPVLHGWRSEFGGCGVPRRGVRPRGAALAALAVPLALGAAAFATPQEEAGAAPPAALPAPAEAAVAPAERRGFQWIPPDFGPFMPALTGMNTAPASVLQSGAIIPQDPLSDASDRVKRELAALGLQYTLDQAFLLSVAGETVQGDAALGGWSFEFLGKFRVYRDEGSSGWVSAEFDGGSGFGVNWEQQSPRQNMGTFTSSMEAWYGEDVWIGELAWGMSFAEGHLALVAGLVDQSNYFDLNGLSNSGYGQLLNTAFIYSAVIPITYNNLGANLQWQPNDSFYVLAGVGTNNQQEGTSPFSRVGAGNLSWLFELGWTPADVLGLGAGVYRLQPFVASRGGDTGGGVGFNFEQALGKESPVGVFGRFGVGGSTVAAIGGAEAEATVGVVAKGASVSPLGLSRSANNYLGLGFGWNRTAAGGQDEYVVEGTWVMQITPTMTLQPDLQVIVDPVFNPGARSAVVFQLQLNMQW